MKFLSVQQRSLLRFPSRLIFLICLSCLSACAASSANTESKTASKPVLVAIATVSQQNMPIQIKAIGNVASFSTVSVKAEVSGQLTGVYFQRGQNVKKGQLLFKIDDRPLKAALLQAQGNLAKDIAQVKQAQANQARDIAQAQNAQADARRYASLLSQGAISRQQANQYTTNATATNATVSADRAAIQNAEAAVEADKAVVENAQVQLSYTSIYAPMDGRVGNVLVDRGNLVQANSTNPLVVISQIHPIQVAFSVPEQELPKIRKYMVGRQLGVEAIIPKDNQRSELGTLNFINNTVDNTTGTIQLLGTFANPQERLWPGQFVNVILNLATEPNAVVVPAQTVQTGQQGPFVFVVKPNSTVESRAVTVDRTINGQIVIAQGLQPGEKVVTDGQLNLVPGAKVAVKNAVRGNAS